MCNLAFDHVVQTSAQAKEPGCPNTLVYVGVSTKNNTAALVTMWGASAKFLATAPMCNGKHYCYQAQDLQNHTETGEPSGSNSIAPIVVGAGCLVCIPGCSGPRPCATDACVRHRSPRDIRPSIGKGPEECRTASRAVGKSMGQDLQVWETGGGPRATDTSL